MKKKYKVEVRKSSQEVCYVTVAAENEQEAEDLACEEAADDDTIEWDYITDTGPEAYDVEEVE